MKLVIINGQEVTLSLPYPRPNQERKLLDLPWNSGFHLGNSRTDAAATRSASNATKK